MGEEGFRRLQAAVEKTDPRLEVSFLGETYTLRENGGLIALLRYASRGGEQEADPANAQSSAFAGIHELLSECIREDQWAKFEQAALDGKADMDDVLPVVHRAIEVYTARPYWPGMRLLAWSAYSLGELDGQVLRGTGRSLATFTAREVCNLMFAWRVENLDDEERQIFLDDLYYEGNPEAEALEMVRRMREDQARARDAGETMAGEAGSDGGN